MKKVIPVVLSGAIAIEPFLGHRSDHVETESRPPDPRQVFDTILMAATTTSTNQSRTIGFSPWGVTE
jgi:hypothetical protein